MSSFGNVWVPCFLFEDYSGSVAMKFRVHQSDLQQNESQLLQVLGQGFQPERGGLLPG